MYLQVLKHKEFGVIRTRSQNGEHWFVVKDVCSALGINNHKQAASTLHAEERGVI